MTKIDEFDCDEWILENMPKVPSKEEIEKAENFADGKLSFCCHSIIKVRVKTNQIFFLCDRCEKDITECVDKLKTELEKDKNENTN